MEGNPIENMLRTERLRDVGDDDRGFAAFYRLMVCFLVVLTHLHIDFPYLLAA
jgi:hypothetical protein